MDLTEFIAENLYSAHAFLAGLSGKDILKLEKEEADELGKSVQNVARHYDIPGVDQKTVDWIRLARTLGMIYGTRIFAMRAMREKHPQGNKPVVVKTDGPAQPERPPAPRMVKSSPGPGLPDVWIEQP